MAVSDTENGTGSCFIIHRHAGSTVAVTYGREVARGRMKEALEKGFEGLESRAVAPSNLNLDENRGLRATKYSRPVRPPNTLKYLSHPTSSHVRT